MGLKISMKDIIEGQGILIRLLYFMIWKRISQTPKIARQTFLRM